MKALLIVSMLLCCGSATAYDSLACGAGLFDCEGITAARTPWVQSEHAELWLRARELSGLPASLDEPFEVSTWLGGARVDVVDSFEVVPLDQVRDARPRILELSVFAQLPDKSYALWDWTSGNEGCPPTGSGELVPDCHAFKSTWVGSTPTTSYLRPSTSSGATTISPLGELRPVGRWRARSALLVATSPPCCRLAIARH